MVDILKVSTNSLLSLQQAMNTTGHNIANVNTEGFSRQTVHFGTVNPQKFGFGFVGQGSQILSIDRSYNDFLTSQIQDYSSNQSRYEVFSEFSSRLDNILANSESSLSNSIQGFFSAVSDVSANPSTLPERQVLIGQAVNLVEKQQSFNNLLQNLNDEVNTAMRMAVTEINGLADGISALNKQIVSGSASGTGAAPNDLLDQRDELVRQLSEKISLSTIKQDDGSLNIFIGKGQSLVVGQQVTHLRVDSNAFDGSRVEIGIEGQFTTNASSQFVTGGELQGLLDFRSRVLLPAQTQLGLVSLGLAETINAQNSAGMDLDGNIGTNMFASATLPISANGFNAGNAQPAATLTDVGELRPSDYQLSFDGTQWHLTRLIDDTTVSGAGPLTLDGMSVDVSVGSAITGDSFIFNPAKTAAANLALTISDPRKIAAAFPVTTDTTSGNSGNSSMTGLTVDPINTLPLPSPVTLTFDPDALGAGVPGFVVTGGPGGIAPLPYDPVSESAGKAFTLGSTGLTFTISEVPVAGDSIVIDNNFGATGDNRNALLMGELQTKAVLNGKVDTYQELYGSMVAQVGVTHSQGKSNLDLETSLLQQAENYKDNVVGVNLDEEAANLLRYQQAYQASAQLVKISEEMFQTLINSIR